MVINIVSTKFLYIYYCLMYGLNLTNIGHKRNKQTSFYDNTTTYFHFNILSMINDECKDINTILIPLSF